MKKTVTKQLYEAPALLCVDVKMSAAIAQSIGLNYNSFGIEEEA